MQYKQKAVIEFLMREGEKRTKIYESLKVIYGEDVLDVSVVCYWAREAQRTLKLLDKDCPGHPKLRRNAEIYAEIDKKVCKNWITPRELSRMTVVGLATTNRFVKGIEY